jgi:hypothetical protein
MFWGAFTCLGLFYGTGDSEAKTIVDNGNSKTAISAPSKKAPKRTIASYDIPVIPALPSGEMPPIQFAKPENAATPYEMVPASGWILYQASDGEMHKAVSFEHPPKAKLTRLEVGAWATNAQGTLELRAATFASFSKGDEVNDEFVIEIPKGDTAKTQVTFTRSDRNTLKPPLKLELKDLSQNSLRREDVSPSERPRTQEGASAGVPKGTSRTSD